MRGAEQKPRASLLPELANSGYVFRDRAEAFELAEEVPTGETSAAWVDAARHHDVYIVAGIAERAGTTLYNSAILLGPSGYIGTFRKMHLWSAENLFFEPGDLGFPVFKTPIGRIGVAICYDGWFPETFRLQALQGADIVCVVTAHSGIDYARVAGRAQLVLDLRNAVPAADERVVKL